MSAENEPAAQGSVIDGMTVREFEGKPAVCVLQLAEKLEYENPYNVRKVYKSLRKQGILSDSDFFSVSEKKSGRGRATVEIWLTESGALDVIMASRTPKARAAYRFIKQVFLAWHRGHLVPANTNALAPADVMAAIARLQSDVLSLKATIIPAGVVDALDSLGRRISFIETHVATDGVIPEARLREMRATVSRIAKFETDAGRWKSRRAAVADVYASLREEVGWGFKSQPWRLLPAALMHTVFVLLHRRETAILRELDLFARNRQTKLKLVDN